MWRSSAEYNGRREKRGAWEPAGRTGNRLADSLAERTGIRVSRDTVYRLLRAGGIQLNRPQHTITSPDPAHAVSKRRWSAPVRR